MLPKTPTIITLGELIRKSLASQEDLDCEENIIIGGDFNCPLDPKLDKKGGVMVPRKMVIDNIECLQNELDLVDVWRIKNPQSRSYTWSQKSPPIFCRLDYWLISNNLQDFVNTTHIIQALKTDHAAIELNLRDLSEISRGRGGGGAVGILNLGSEMR